MSKGMRKDVIAAQALKHELDGTYGIDAYRGIGESYLKIPELDERKRFEYRYKRFKGWRPKYPSYKKGVDYNLMRYMDNYNMNPQVQERYTKEYVKLREKYYTPKLEHTVDDYEMPAYQNKVPFKFNNLAKSSGDISAIHGKKGSYSREKLSRDRLDVLLGVKFRSGINKSLPYKSHKYIYPYMKKGYNSTKDFNSFFGDKRGQKYKKNTKYFKVSDTKINPFLKRGEGFFAQYSRKDGMKTGDVVGNDKNLHTKAGITYRTTANVPNRNTNEIKYKNPYEDKVFRKIKAADLFKVKIRPIPSNNRRDFLMQDIAHYTTSKAPAIKYLPEALDNVIGREYKVIKGKPVFIKK